MFRKGQSHLAIMDKNLIRFSCFFSDNSTLLLKNIYFFHSLRKWLKNDFFLVVAYFDSQWNWFFVHLFPKLEPGNMLISPRAHLSLSNICPIQIRLLVTTSIIKDSVTDSCFHDRFFYLKKQMLKITLKCVLKLNSCFSSGTFWC